MSKDNRTFLAFWIQFESMGFFIPGVKKGLWSCFKMYLVWIWPFIRELWHLELKSLSLGRPGSATSDSDLCENKPIQRTFQFLWLPCLINKKKCVLWFLLRKYSECHKNSLKVYKQSSSIISYEEMDHENLNNLNFL